MKTTQAKKERLINRLKKAAGLLQTSWVELQELNDGENQFDYVNAPRLSDVCDTVSNKAKLIEKIIYQKS